MKHHSTSILSAIASFGMIAGITVPATAQTTAVSQGPYHVLKTSKVGGVGGFDYVYADSDGRRLYVARSRQNPRISIFDLDTFAPTGEIGGTNAHGVAVDTKSNHAFASSNPVAMWDTTTNTLIKTIPVGGGPDGILADNFNHRIYIFSHEAPNATVIDAGNGNVLGTIDLGGAPEQAATDGMGHLYVDLEDKDSVAVVDARTMRVSATYSLNGKGGGNAGLALDAKNHVLFVACRDPQVMVMLDAKDGKYLADLPIGRGCDGVVFNPATGECFSSQGDGTLNIIKETSPTTFVAEQTVKTMTGAKTLTLDTKTGNVVLIAAEYLAPPATQPADGGQPAAAGAPPAQGGQPGGGGGRRGGRRQMVPDSFTILAVGK